MALSTCGLAALEAYLRGVQAAQVPSAVRVRERPRAAAWPGARGPYRGGMLLLADGASVLAELHDVLGGGVLACGTVHSAP